MTSFIKSALDLGKPKKSSQAQSFKDLPKDLRKLLTMLTYKRPAGSQTEADFIKRYITPTGARADRSGNHWLVIPGNPDLLFSSHTDTVHKTDGMQLVLYGAGIASVDQQNCLGADDGVGVWLMLEMIRHKVPGSYLFHAEEECGGVGSSQLADDAPDWLAQHKFAIAFDRKGTDEIITHQFEGRTASDEFAHSLANILKPLSYAPSDGGTFTDTANYAHLIAECTNLSVGYEKQHQKVEYLDVGHAAALRDALVAADWSGLSAHRLPGKPVHEPYKWAQSNWNTKQSSEWWRDNDDPGEDLWDYVRREALHVAEYLEAHGVTKQDIEDYYLGIEPADAARDPYDDDEGAAY